VAGHHLTNLPKYVLSELQHSCSPSCSLSLLSLVSVCIGVLVYVGEEKMKTKTKESFPHFSNDIMSLEKVSSESSSRDILRIILILRNVKGIGLLNIDESIFIKNFKE
jgi:hypothetical protein